MISCTVALGLMTSWPFIVKAATGRFSMRGSLRPVVHFFVGMRVDQALADGLFPPRLQDVERDQEDGPATAIQFAAPGARRLPQTKRLERDARFALLIPGWVPELLGPFAEG